MRNSRNLHLISRSIIPTSENTRFYQPMQRGNLYEMHIAANCRCTSSVVKADELRGSELLLMCNQLVMSKSMETVSKS